MRECIKCGGSALRDYAWGCEHDFGEAPDPEAVGSFFLNDERMFMATGEIAGMRFSTEHPTRDGAIALWQERWRWAPAIQALFGWLCGRPEHDRSTPCPQFLGVNVKIRKNVEGLQLIAADMARTNQARKIAYTVEQRLSEYPSCTMVIAGRGLEFSYARDGMTSIAVKRRPGNDADAPLAVYGGFHELMGDVHALLGGEGPLAEAGQ